MRARRHVLRHTCIAMKARSGRKDWTDHYRRSGRSMSNRTRRPGSRQKSFLGETAFGSTTTIFFFSAAPPGKRRMRFIECPGMEKSKTPDQERAVSKREHALGYDPATVALSGALQPNAKSEAGGFKHLWFNATDRESKIYPRFFASLRMTIGLQSDRWFNSATPELWQAPH
jgi:hypothetical protein